jgi:hypothetical protein
MSRGVLGNVQSDPGLDRPLMDYDLTFDYVGILPRHLEHVPILAERLPTLRPLI